MSKVDDRGHNFGLVLAMIFLVATVFLSYAVVHFAETCEMELGFSDIVPAVKRLIADGGCKG